MKNSICFERKRIVERPHSRSKREISPRERDISTIYNSFLIRTRSVWLLRNEETNKKALINLYAFRNVIKISLTVIYIRLDRRYSQILPKILYSCCIQLRLRRQGHCLDCWSPRRTLLNATVTADARYFSPPIAGAYQRWRHRFWSIKLQIRSRGLNGFNFKWDVRSRITWNYFLMRYKNDIIFPSVSRLSFIYENWKKLFSKIFFNRHETIYTSIEKNY